MYTDKYIEFMSLQQSKTKSIKNSQQYIILNRFELLGTTLGYVAIEGNLEHYRKQVGENIESLILLAIFLIIIILFISYYLAKMISGPLNSIVKKLDNTTENETLEFNKYSEVEFHYLTQVIQKNIMNFYN